MILAYKAFHKGLVGANKFQFEIGKTYTSNNDGIGRHAFHASLDPIFCLNFVSPFRNGAYAEVRLDGAIDRGGVNSTWSCCGDAAISAESITIDRLLSIEEMLLASIKYRIEKAAEKNTLSRSSETRFGAILTNMQEAAAIADAEGHDVQVTGGDSLALAQGFDCTAYAEGHNSIAAAITPQCWAGGGKKAWILITDWEDPSSSLWVRNPKEGILYALNEGKVMTKKRA